MARCCCARLRRSCPRKNSRCRERERIGTLSKPEWTCGRGERASRAKHEIVCAGQTQTSPEIIQSNALMHVKDGEWGENQKRDHFLQDLQLSEAHRGVAGAVGRDLQ